MHFADKWNHVVFAEGENFNIFDDDQLIVVFVENCAINEVSHVLFITFGEKHKGFGITFGGMEEAFSGRIFANTLENRADSSRKLV